jgi:nonsense-mediated mRNA decay protein 3
MKIEWLSPPPPTWASQSTSLSIIIHFSLSSADAVWIWTEPHSLRLHIKLTIQKEVMNGAILQQVTIQLHNILQALYPFFHFAKGLLYTSSVWLQAALVEFTVRNQQCKDCQQDFATGSWHAVVQVRQRVTHKRTFYYLEQLLLKHNAHSDCLNIVTFRDGMDFYFTEKQKAVRFIDFLESHVPTKVLLDFFFGMIIAIQANLNGVS